MNKPSELCSEWFDVYGKCDTGVTPVTVVTFDCAPAMGAVPEHVAVQVHLWGDWLDNMGHGLNITYMVEHTIHCLGQQ